MQIAIEYIKWLADERGKINSTPLEEIEFFENGMRVEIPKKAIDEWLFTGLNNVDFILTGAWMEYRAASIERLRDGEG